MKNIILDWDETQLAEDGLGWYREMAVDDDRDPEKITIEDIYNDVYFWKRELEDKCDALTELMKGREYWKIEGTDMGWLKRSGYKYVMCTNGRELLEAVLPETDTTWSMCRKGKGFAMKVSHHDAPTGEYYLLKPVAESTYYKNI